jgi:prepilin-type N-terminal cleavage/methylation domain-containing protein
MKPRRPPNGFTLIEMSLVIFLIVFLATSGLFFSSKIGEWRRARLASETLRSVYVAQRMFLADHPVTAISALKPKNLLPYIPNHPATFPTIKALDGSTLQINVAVSPPIVDAGDGTAYDPSGNPTDSLWDVGE